MCMDVCLHILPSAVIVKISLNLPPTILFTFSPRKKLGGRGAALADGILHHIPLTCFIWLAESVGHGMQIVRLPPPAFALPGLAPPVGALPALAGAPPAKKSTWGSDAAEKSPRI